MSLLIEKPISQDIWGKVLPDDPHNRTLVGNVYPADWTNPEPAPRYNLVVVGAGTAGLVTAAGAAGLGARVALVERHLLGGDCLNYGCVPSKGIISAARIAAAVRDADRFGVHVPDGWNADFGAAMERMRKLRAGSANTIRRPDSATWASTSSSATASSSAQTRSLSPSRKRGQSPFAGTARRVLRTNGDCPLFRCSDSARR